MRKALGGSLVVGERDGKLSSGNWGVVKIIGNFVGGCGQKLASGFREHSNLMQFLS